MTFYKGDKKISVEQIDGFGKNPGLWVSKGNALIKVASFGSEEKAKMFEKQMMEIFYKSEDESITISGGENDA